MFTFSNIHSLLNSNLDKVPLDIDLVVGIPRTGLIPASHIAALLNIPLQTLNEVTTGVSLDQKHTIRKIFSTKSPRHILLVDDTSNTGLRINSALRIIRSRWKNIKVTTMVICSASNSDFRPDLHLEQSPTPRLFAWNMLNHDKTPDVAVDLDGVLCLDPSPSENDDGEKYLVFLQSAVRKTIPATKVKAVITGRLEKYRHQTERWLRTNGVSYGDLLMNDAPTASYRREKRFEIGGLNIDQISEFKSRMVRAINPVLFVESNLNQARNVHHLTQVNTYAFEDDIYFGSTDFEF